MSSLKVWLFVFELITASGGHAQPSTTAPKLEPTSASAPRPTSASAPESTPAQSSTTAPKVLSTPEPIAALTPEPTPAQTSTTSSKVHPTPEPITAPTPEPTAAQTSTAVPRVPPTPEPIATPTPEPTHAQTSAVVPRVSPTPEPTAALTPEPTPVQTSTAAPKVPPTQEPTAAPTPESTPAQTSTAAPAVLPTPEPTAALTPEPNPAQASTTSSKVHPAPEPITAPTPEPTAAQTSTTVPRVPPTPEPIATPTPEPTHAQTSAVVPRVSPTPEPTSALTPEPTPVQTSTTAPKVPPTQEPTAAPTPEATPAQTSTAAPTVLPTPEPTAALTPEPNPAQASTTAPNVPPTPEPIAAPTPEPTAAQTSTTVPSVPPTPKPIATPTPEPLAPRMPPTPEPSAALMPVQTSTTAPKVPPTPEPIAALTPDPTPAQAPTTAPKVAPKPEPTAAPTPEATPAQTSTAVPKALPTPEPTPTSEPTAAQTSTTAPELPPTPEPIAAPTPEPTPTPTESEQVQRLHEAQEQEVEAEKKAAALFAQLKNRSEAIQQSSRNQSLAANAAQLISSTVDEIVSGPQKQLEASIESSLSTLDDEIANLTRNSSVVTAQANFDVQLKFIEVKAAMSALRELDEDEITAMQRGYELAQKSEKKSDKSLVKETFHAAKAWLKAGRRTEKAQKHAGIPERVYERHYGEVESSAETRMDKVEDLGDDISDNIEQFYGWVETHVEAMMDEKREEFNAKEAEYEDVLFKLESRYNEATTYTYFPNRVALQLIAHAPAGSTVKPVSAETDQVARDAQKTEKGAFLFKKSEDKSKAHAMKLLAALRAYAQEIETTLNKTEAAKTAEHFTSKAEQTVHNERSQLTLAFAAQAKGFDEASQHLLSANLTPDLDLVQAQESLAKAAQHSKSAALFADRLGRLDEEEARTVRRVRNEARQALLGKVKSLTKATLAAGKEWLNAARQSLKAQSATSSKEEDDEEAQEAAFSHLEGQTDIFAGQAKHLGESLENLIRDHFEKVSESLESHLTEVQRHRYQREHVVKYHDKMLLQVRKVVTSRLGNLSARHITAGSVVYPTALTEAAVVMQSSNGWFGFPALVLAFLSGSLFVFVMDHFRFRQRHSFSAQSPLLLG